MTSARAVVLEAFGLMTVSTIEVRDPDVGEVRVRVAATGICGSDLHGYTGENGRRSPGQVMGHETVGVVESVGAEVESVRIGDRVTINPVMIPDADRVAFRGREQHSPARRVLGVAPDVRAAFADLVVAPAVNVVPIAASMPLRLGALIEPLAVAVHAVSRVGLQSGQPLLVIGGGPIGQSVVIAALAAGASRVLVSEPDPARRALCESLGAVGLDPAGSIRDLVIAQLGEPVDVVIDAVGVSATIADAFAASSAGARICLVGMGAHALNLQAYQLSTEERTIVGSFCYSDSDFRAAAELAGERAGELGALISAEVSPDAADAAFQRLLVAGEVPGKILVRFDGG